MRQVRHVYKNDKNEFIERIYQERFISATPKKSFFSWREGVEYGVFIQNMWHKKIAIYKNNKHFNEDSGYKVFDTLDDLFGCFDVKKGLEFLSEKELGTSYTPRMNETILNYSDRENMQQVRY